MKKLINISYKHYNKALDYINDNKISMAKEELEKSISIYGKDIDTLNLIGMCEYMLCNFSKAYTYWSESTKYNNIDNKAIEYINYLSKNEFIYLVKRYNVGLDYFHNKKYKEAIEVFENIINENEDLIEPYEILFICNNNLNNVINAHKYAKILNEKDKDNITNYAYLNLFNSKSMNTKNHVKSRTVKVKSNRFTFYLLGVTIIGVLGFSYSFYKKYKIEQNKSISIEKELNEINKNYELLVEDMEKEKLKNKEINNVIKLDSDENKQTIFNNAVNYYKNRDYKNAINSFEYIINNFDEDEYVKSEAIYFLAVSNEKIKDSKKAKKYYEDYINKYNTHSLYDDALYNYALILDKEGNIKRAKELLSKLKYECPKSIFINSNTINILQK